MRSFGGVIRVVAVDPSSDAAKAGIETGDILIAIDGQRLYVLPQEVEGLKPGRRVKLQVMHGSKSLTIKFRLGSQPSTTYRIEEIPNPTPEQTEIREGWLEGKTRNSE